MGEMGGSDVLENASLEGRFEISAAVVLTAPLFEIDDGTCDGVRLDDAKTLVTVGMFATVGICESSVSTSVRFEYFVT